MGGLVLREQPSRTCRPATRPGFPAVWLAALVVALVPAPASAASEMSTVVQDDAVLLHGADSDVDTALGRLASLGVDEIRLTAGWWRIAPNPGSRKRPDFNAADPNAYPLGAWRSLDRAARMSSRHGLRVMIDIGFWAPRWAVGRGRPGVRQRHGVDPQEFGRFAEAVARRYSGSFRPAEERGSSPLVLVRRPLPRAASYTLWNEPNDPGFLLPQWRRRGSHWWAASPHLYREMVRAAHPRIKEVAPHSLVLIGGTAAKGASPTVARGEGVPPLRFLREMACLNGRLAPMRRRECRGFTALPGDGWAHHPYSLGLAPWEADPRPDNVRMADLDRMTSLLQRLHRLGRTQEKMELYVTEYGYQTNPPDPTQPFGLDDQARFLPEAELIAWANPAVRSFAQFLLRDRPERQVAGGLPARWRDYQTGLQFADGTPKPAETAFKYAFVVRRAGQAAIRVWGHVRHGHGPQTVRIATPLAGGVWSPLPDVAAVIQTDEHGYFQGTLRGDPDALYRVEVLSQGVWEPGVALRAVR